MIPRLARTVLFAAVSLALAACATGTSDKKMFVVDLKTAKGPAQVEAAQRGTWLVDNGYRVITPSGKLSRSCTVVPVTGHIIYCESTYSGFSQVVRTDGSLVTWNLVESWSKDGCDASENNGDYRTAHNTSNVSFGWGPKRGESHHASAFTKFTNPGVTVSGNTKTVTCP